MSKVNIKVEGITSGAVVEDGLGQRGGGVYLDGAAAEGVEVEGVGCGVGCRGEGGFGRGRVGVGEEGG